MKVVRLGAYLKPIGKQGEHGVTRVEIDATKLLQDFPNGSPVINYTRADGSCYPVPCEMDGAICWFVPEENETFIKGNVKVEIAWYVDDNLAKSYTYYAEIIESVGEPSDPPDLPGESWVEQIAGMVQDISDKVDEAVPEGGEEGQVLTKHDGANVWSDPQGGGAVESVNGKTGAVVLDAEDVGALPDDTVIPDALVDLEQDANHRTVTDAEKAAWSAKQPAGDYALESELAAEIEARQESETDLQEQINEKQDAISDLETIRSGAAAGATAYQKPSSGVPKTDLASDVKTSLDLADTALQSFTEIDPTVPEWAKASSKPTYTATEVGAATQEDIDTAADNLQEQIDALVSKSDVVDVVGTYAELQAYDTSTLGNNDVVKVLSDSTHDNARTYYRWGISGSSGSWTYVGSESVGYTKSETDTLLNAKQPTISDLDTIRSGAAAGATALQPSALDAYRTASSQDTIDNGKVSKSAQASKTSAMTNEVGIDSNGKLWSSGGGGSSDPHPYALDGKNLKSIFGSAADLYAALAQEDYSQIHNLDYWPITFNGTYRDYGEWVALAGTDYYSDTACKDLVGQVENDTVVSYEDASPAYYSATIGGTKRYIKMQDCQRWREKTINMTAKMEANINAYWGYGDSGTISGKVPHIMWLARDGIASLKFRSTNQQWADAVEQIETSDGTTTEYTPDDATLKCVRYCTVDGVLKAHNTDYTVDTGTGKLTFKSGKVPTSGQEIIISRTTHDYPWKGSALYQTFNDPDHGLLRLIDDTEFAGHIYGGAGGLGMRYAGETRTVANGTGVNWTDRGKMFLPTESEVWGLGIYGQKDTWYHLPQLAVFANGGRRRLSKGASDGGSRASWWVASSTSATHIAIVNSSGNASNGNARYAYAAVPGFIGT